MISVGRRSTTVLQIDSVYSQRWSCPPGDPWPVGGTTTTEFYDSAGNVVQILDGLLDSNYLTFTAPSDALNDVLNGAGFSVFVTDDEGPHCVRYGTVMRRQNFFPTFTTGQFGLQHVVDDFQRPAGAVGKRWVDVLGNAKITTNGADPNGVRPNANLYGRYFTRFSSPMSDDPVTIKTTILNTAGGGKAGVALTCNSDASFFQYVLWESGTRNLIHSGIGQDTDIGDFLFDPSALTPMIAPVAHVVPTHGADYRVRFDRETKTLSVTTLDESTEYLSWSDDDDLIPHGLGFRYVAICGGLLGTQVAYFEAMDDGA